VTETTETRSDYSMLSMSSVRMVNMVRAEIAAITPSTQERKEIFDLMCSMLESVSRGMDSKYEEFLHETSARVPSLPHNRVLVEPGTASSTFPADHYYVAVVLPRGEFAYPYLGTDPIEAFAIYEAQALRVSAGVLRAARLVAPGQVLRLGVRRLHGNVVTRKGRKPVRAKSKRR